jgi:uncharacterized protein GlcG (DUF336 family)
MEKARKTLGITSDLATRMIERAVAKAREIKVALALAVLDEGGNLKAFCRMDGAPVLCSEIAQNKAYTALFGVPTHDFYNLIKHDPSLVAGIPNMPRIAAFGGGFPIRFENAVIGAMGASGGSVEQDMAAVEAALEVLK